MRGDILRKLEQLEAALTLPGLNRQGLEALSDVELAAWVAWFEAGEPEDAEAWVDEWIATRPEPEPASRVVTRAVPEPRQTTEAPPPPSDAAEPVEVVEEPRSYGGDRRVVRSGDPPPSRPRKTWEDEVEMVRAPEEPWRYVVW